MKKEILNEIIEIAPTLVKIGNKNRFLVPDQYFEKLDLELNTILGTKTERIPKNYFEKLQDEVLIQVRPKKSARLFSLNAKKWVAAASITLVCIASFVTINKKPHNNDNQSLAFDIELEEALDYLADYEDVSMSELIDLIDLEESEDLLGDLDDDEIDLLLDDTTLTDLGDLLM